MADRIRSDEVPLRENTVGGLLATLQAVFADPLRIERVVYTRGKALHVDRWVPEEAMPQDTDTPFATIRREAELHIVTPSPGDTHLHTFLQLLNACVEEGRPATNVVVRDVEKFRKWVFQGNEWSLNLFSLNFVVDPELPRGSFALCGSSKGAFIMDVELCLLCQVQK